jgi:putative hydrolase of HD superfamily
MHLTRSGLVFVFGSLLSDMSISALRRPTPTPGASLDFFSVIGKLKTLKRTGWVDNEIPLPESVADHMYRMSMLSFLITDEQVNRDELIKICLMHDVAEAKVGDITPYDGVSKEEKRRLEEAAIREILGDIGQAAIGDEMLRLWMARRGQFSHRPRRQAAGQV